MGRKVLGVWGSNPRGNGSSLLLFDKHGVYRLGLYVFDDADASADLRDSSGKSKMRLGVVGKGASSISLFGTDSDEAALVMQVSPDGSSLLVVGNSRKSNRLRVSSSVDGDVFLSASSTGGQEALNAYSRSSGR